MKGFDISEHQRGLNLAATKADFLIIRIGYGTSGTDPLFESFYNSAISLGIPVGAYYYSYATSTETAIRDANRALSLIHGRPLPLGLYMDVEDQSQMRLSDSFLTAVVKAWCDTIKAGGYLAGAYGSDGNLWGKVGPSYLGDDVLVWVAAWSKRPHIACDIWQTSENGYIDGIKIDTDESCSTRFEALVNGTQPAPQPEPQSEPSYEPFSIDGIPVIKHGDYDKDGGCAVKALQGELIAQGYPCGGKKDWRGAEKPDGIFGNVTQESVRCFQRSRNLPDTGIADKATRTALLGIK